MVKFSKELNSNITPEWRKQYIPYERLKSKLDKHMAEAPDAQFVAEDAVFVYHKKFSENWFHDCDNEHAKITAFFQEKRAEAVRRFVSLKDELSKAHASSENRKMNDKLLKTAFSEFYLSLIMTQNYVKHNLQGFQKIMKKFDKNLNCKDGAQWQEEKLSVSELKKSQDIDKMLVQVENLFINQLEAGNRKKAMARLKVPPLGNVSDPALSIKVGFFGGCICVLMLLIIGTATIMHKQRVIPDDDQIEALRLTNTTTQFQYRSDWNIVTRLYRGPLLVIILIGLLGLNIKGWAKSGVNHVLIFELDPRHHSSHLQVLELALGLGLTWAASLLLFLFADYIALPAFASPLGLLAFYALFFLNPTKTGKYKERQWMMGVFLRIVITPLSYVTFADFWVADQLNSIQPIFPDLYYWYCFYTSLGDKNSWYLATDDSVCRKPNGWALVLACLPAWFRFVHCLRRYRDTRHAFPHLTNAGKYTTTLVTNLIHFIFAMLSGVTAQVFYALYLFSKTISTFYALAWDLKMDWGFFAANAGENTLLREETVYPSTLYYYLAMAEDIILRLLWVVGLILKQTTGLPHELIGSVQQIAEVFRRFVWNFFRLENEHLNNCGQFRVVRDISIAPVDMKDQEELIMMMDFKDGAQRVRQRRRELGKLDQ